MTNLANRLPDSQPPLSAAAFNARRDINRDKYAASGYIEPGRHYDGAFADDVFGPGGMWTSNAIVQGIRFGRNSRDSTGTSNSGNPIFHVDGLVITMAGLNWVNEENNQIDLPAAPTGQIETTTLTTRDYAQGDHVVVGNDIYVCIHPDGSVAGDVLSDTDLFERDDVVSREDLIGLEVFLVQLGDGNGAVDAVYPHGNVQYTPTTVDGQFSLSSNAMPQSYSAMFLGDTDTVGRGLKWSTLTPEQRNLWAQKASNNIYVEDGKYFQWQYRARVFKSRGGQWHVATAWDSTSWAIRDRRNSDQSTTNGRYPTLQGSALTPNPDSVSGVDAGYTASYFLTTLNNGFPLEVNKGVAATANSSNSRTRSANGIGYFLSLAKITRLNQGGYHPVYNPTGTKTFRRQDINGDNRWDNVNTFKPTSTAECFQIGETAQSEGIYIHSGLLRSARSGHPQDYRSDIVYGWQVEDLRMDAHGFNMTPDEFANKLLYNNMPAMEPAKVLRVMDTVIEEIVDDFSYYVEDNILDEWGIVAAYQGAGYLYNKDKQELMPISIYHHSTGRILIQPLKDEIQVENIGRFYSSTLLKSGDRKSWTVGDVVTFIGYKETKYYTGIQECVDVIATPERLLEAFSEYGVDRMVNALWTPAELGSNPGAGVVVKARRKVENAYNAYIKYSDRISVKTDYNNDFEFNGNAASLIEDETAFVMFTYNTPSVALTPYNFGYRLLDGEFGSAWITDNNASGEGGTLAYNLIGKVPVNLAYNEAIALQIQKAGMQYNSLDFDSVATSSYSEIAHTNIPYTFLDDGVKFVPFFSISEPRGIVNGQVMFKEVRATESTRDYRTIDVSSAVEVSLVAGERFKLVGTGLTNFDNRYLVALSTYTATWSPGAFEGYSLDTDDGRIYTAAGNIWSGARLDALANADSGTIEPRSWMFYDKDLNQNDIRVGTMITTRPLGFLPKRQRRNKM